MIPLSDPDNRRRSFPIATVTIIALNAIVFAYEISLTPRALDATVLAYGVRPLEIMTGQDLPPLSPHPLWLTIVTSMFLHGGWTHILGNMLFLWVFGDNVEDALGTLTYLAFYLTAGFAGAFAHILANPESTAPSIGASGAIAGVLAAYMVFYPGARINTLLFIFIFFRVVRIPAIVLIGFWALIQILSGIGSLGAPDESGVAYWAHIGGFLAGLIIAVPFRGRARRARGG